MLRYIGSWIASATLTTFLGVMLQTQIVINRLNDIGADIGVDARMSMTGYDLQHFGTIYLLVIAAGFLIAFGAAEYLSGKIVRGRIVIFALAGFVAMLVILFTAKQIYFDIHMVAGARDNLGIGLQAIAGIMGGVVFAVLTSRRDERR